MGSRYSKGLLSLILLWCVGCFSSQPQPIVEEPETLTSPYGNAVRDSVADAPVATSRYSNAPMLVFPAKASESKDYRNDNYRLGVLDKIRFEVLGEAKLSFEYEVPESGMISYPWIGDLPLNDRTVEEVRTELYQRLEAEYLIDPRVFVRVTEYKSKPIEIIGPIKEPGTYHLASNTTDVIRLVAMAGGFEENRGSYATIEHRDKRQAFSVDLSALVDRGDLTWNKTIFPGDTVVISNRDFEDLRNTQVSIMGEVKRAGTIAWQPGLTLPSAIARAGGPTQFGAPNRTEIIRTGADGNRKKIDIDLEDIDEAGNFELLPGDIIRIPQSRF